jgi:shikimate kinase
MKIFLIGFMGCGKSHWGKQLSAKMKLPFFDLDDKIEEQEGKTIPEIFAVKGEEYFRMQEKEVLHLLSESHESFVMACGGGTPCFYNNIDYLKKQGTVVWINCSVDCLFSRLIKEKEKRPLISDLSDEALRSFIVKKYSTRKIYYQQAQVVINTDNLTLPTLIDRIFHQT